MGSRWIPRIPIPNTLQPPPPPPQDQDHQAPKYIVGNSAAGDTIFVCDFLDTGNGAGVAAALAAAAGTPGDVWIRPGVYNFGAVGAPAMPLTVPSSVRLVGAGGRGSAGTGFGSDALVTFVADTVTTQDVLVLGDGASVEEIRFALAQQAGAAVGTGVVRMEGELSAVRRCSFLMSNVDLTTRVACSTGAGQAQGCVVEDCDFTLPSSPSTLAGNPFTAVRFGVGGVETLWQNGGPIARRLRVQSGEVGVLFESCAGGVAESITHLGAVSSSAINFSAAVAWSMNTSVVTDVPGCRIDGVIFESDSGENAAGDQIGVLIEHHGAGAGLRTAQGFSVSNVLVRFVPGGNPLTSRLGMRVRAGEGGGGGRLRDVQICNVAVSGHSTGITMDTNTVSATAGAGELQDVRLTNYNAPAPRVLGAHGARGAEILSPGGTAKVRRIGIVNCDFTLAPATGAGLDIGANVTNTIAVANQLTPSGGTALVDLGTGTELGHNIVA